jgi:cell division septation protein DedD
VEERTKQRLIGVLVIIGALFIILPFLFHNSRPTVSQQTSTHMPNQLGTPSVALALPAAVAPAAVASAAPTTTSPAASEPTAENTSAVAPTEETQVAQSATPPTTMPTAGSGSAAPSVAVNTPSNPSAANDMPVAGNVTAASNNSMTTPSNSANDANKPANSVAAAAIAAMPTPKMASASTTTAVKVSPLVKSGEFSGAPATKNELTTGQANEGPTQAMPSTAAAATQPLVSTTPAMTQPTTASHTQHAKQNHAAATLAMHSKRDAWMIQLGVFSNKKNANHLMSKLRAAHYDVHSHSVKHGQETLVAIYVGPETNLHKTEMMKQHLKQRFQIAGVVKKYHA